MERVVARIGRAHGLRGQVSVEVRTDVPGRRFVPAAVFSTDPAEVGPLTLTSARDHGGVLLLTFQGIETREDAEALRGTQLLVDAPASDEPDAWYEHELTGLAAERVDGVHLGEVTGLETGGAQDLLVVRPAVDGPPVLVPFVTALVPVVDLPGGRVVLDPPGGLFEPPDDDADHGGEDAERTAEAASDDPASR